MENNNVKQTNLRQADAKVTVAGIVSDKKLEMKTENGLLKELLQLRPLTLILFR